MTTTNAIPDPLIGETLLGRYTVQSVLGEGGMGMVYLAMQVGLGRQVVLKVLLEKFANDPIAVARFESEAQAVSLLNQPNIVTVYEFGRSEKGVVFLAMEYCPGKTLLERLRVGALPADEAKEIILGIAKALKAAHAAGIVHRDLKPENIMLTNSPTEGRVVKVLDFGLAKMVQQDQSQGLTADDVIMGTPGYMSPEQIAGKQLDGRSDLYALGVIWWEMLTGRPIFTADSHIQVLVKHTNDAVTPLSQIVPGKVDAATENLILNLCQKQANARPMNGGAVVELIGKLKEQAAQLSTNLADVDDFFAGGSSPGGEAVPRKAPDLSPSLGDLQAQFAAPAAPLAAADKPSIVVNHATVPPANDYLAMMADVADDDVIPGGTPFSLGETEPEQAELRAANALGTHASIAPGLPPSAQPAGLLWQVEAYGRLTTQVPLVELRRWIQQGKVTAKDSVAPMGQPLKPLPEFASFAALLESLRLQQEEAQKPNQKRRKPKRTKGRSGAGSKRRGLKVLVVILGVLFAGVGGTYIFARDALDVFLKDVEQIAANVIDDVKFQVGGTQGTRLAPWIEKWKKVHVQVEESVPQLLERVERLLENPTPSSRAEVQLLLEQALVKAPAHTTATALYLQNAGAQPRAKERFIKLRANKVLEDLEEAMAGDSDVQAAKTVVRWVEKNLPEAMDAACRAEEAAATSGQSVRAKKWKAQVQLAQNNLKGAQETLDGAVALSRRNTELALLGGQIAFAQGKLRYAAALAQKRVQAVKDDSHAAQLLAWVAREENNFLGSVRPLQVLLKRNPADDEIRSLLARIYVEKGEAKTAFRLLNKAPESEGALSLRASLLAQKADLALAKGDVVKARKWVRNALEDDSKNAVAHRVLGRIYEVLGELEKAKISFAASATFSPSRAFAANAKAEAAFAFLMAQKASEAVALAEEALGFDKNCLLAHEVRLIALLEQGKLSVGHQSLNEMLTLNPRRELGNTRLPILGALTKENLRLLEYTRQLRIPKMDAAYENLVKGVLYFNSEHRKKAAGFLAKALRKNRELALPVLLLAHLDVQAKRPKKATRKLQALVAQHQSPLQAQLLLAELEINAQKFDAAELRLNSLGKAAFKNEQRLFLLGNLAAGKRDLPKARSFWLKAVEIDRFYKVARRALRENEAL